MNRNYLPNNELTHRSHEGKIDQTLNVIQFAQGGNEHYGNHIWSLKSKLPEVPSSVVKFTKKYYNVSTEEASRYLNPENIVGDAGAWDDRQFVSDLWQEMEAGRIKEHAGFRTPDGAVVLDKHGVKLEHRVEE